MKNRYNDGQEISMTIETDILKKLELVKKEVKDSKKIEPVKSDNIKGKIVKDEKESRSPFKHQSSAKGQSAILLLFDATGSMSNLWSATRDIMEEMIERITEVGSAKIKCVAYRDYCDGDKIFEYSGWHTTAEPLLNFLGRIHCDGGGDEPEAVEDALELAYKEKENVTRVILIGDAQPHSLEKAVQQATNLGKKGRPVFAFGAGSSSSTIHSFSQIAEASRGHYADIGNYEDLLDMMSVTIIHDVGGSEEVEKYIKKYDISEGVKEYSKSLPSYKK